MVTTRSKSLKAGSDDGGTQYSDELIKVKSKKLRNGPLNDSKYCSLIIFISTLLDLLAFTIILPIFPRLLKYYQLNDPANGLYTYLNHKIDCFGDLIGVPSEFNFVLFGGFLGSLFSFLQFLASPIVGAFSDVYGRKIIILFCLIGLSVSYSLWSISVSFSTFVISRIIAGISKGNLSLSMAAITDISSMENRGSGMALIGSAFSVGFVIGPMIGVYCIDETALRKEDVLFFKPAMIALSLIVTDVLFVSFCFKETLSKQKRLKSIVESLRHASNYVNPKDLFRFAAVKSVPVKDLKQLRMLGMIYFLHLFFYSGLEFTMTFLLHHKFEFNSKNIGLIFCAIGVTMAILQGGGVRMISAESTHKFASLGLFLTIPSFLCVGLAQTHIVLYFGIFLYSVATSVVVPCMTTLVSNYGTASQKGTALGIFRSLGALARAFGPIVASTAYWGVGSRITYCIGGLMLFVPWYLMKTMPGLKT